ncbi:hypothetical protein MTR67_037457 [Solanum verrucosum]|uniref:Cellulose synthase-like protein G3 n=1 Tax=Solanum verrucosum TaxID=315347 RepID=A0AAF0ZLZ9_SOLVR|nr:hypothetical protein MTR67_037457 [Solanum verrucosum]
METTTTSAAVTTTVNTGGLHSVEVLLESGKDEDMTSHGMPNLIYLSREKNKSSPHHFKAGALNALLRVSGIMTNAPIVLTLDCDMYSNDPSTPQRALCYFLDPTLRPNLAYVQFPQTFHGLNEADIYASEIKGLFFTNPIGMDGLNGPNYVGTGCFFRRRAFFGTPSTFEQPEIPELFPDHVVNKPIQAQEILRRAHYVASCNYESGSNWGSKMGFRYGSLVEDYYTGYRLQCEGWKSVFCNPKRPAFLGDIPISLYDVVSQNKRWSVGLLEVAFSKYSPLTFGVQSMGLVMAHCYSHYAFWPIWSIPLTLYAFIPQLTLLNGVTIFPKLMYENMKKRIEEVIERGKVGEDYINNEEELQAFTKYWTLGFTRHNHPSIIQVLLESGKDKDMTSHGMPNLIYFSREKNTSSPHHFKAGALNALLRVSGIMTNAPIILTLDCDMYSNDPSTPQRALCYFLDQTLRPNLAYVQFPQTFHGLNEADIYANEIKALFFTNPMGMDGLNGPNYVGTGCFFHRRAFFGTPSSFEQPEIPELFPDHVVNKPIKAQEVLWRAHYVASCNYESESNWGSKMGFRYGSLVEDYYTGYRLQCEGWKSVFCNPKRPAFLGDKPISLYDVVSQNKRWNVGLLEVALSKYSPLTFGVQSMGLVMAHCYSHYPFSPIWSIPLTLYAFIPQLTLLNGVTIFPKVSDPWFFLYIFMFLGAYGQDCLVFMSNEGTFKRWWSDQRMWMIRGLTSHLFGTIEYLTKHLGISTQGFNVTSKVVDNDQGKRYHQGIFEFGVVSPMFVILATTSIINLVAFLKSLAQIIKGDQNLDGKFIQMFIAGFVVINCLPIYEAMVLRSDKGRMPTRVTIFSTFLACTLYMAFAFLLGNM